MDKPLNLRTKAYRFIFENTPEYSLGMQTFQQLSNILESQNVASISAKMFAEEGEETIWDFVAFYKNGEQPGTDDYMKTIADIMYATQVNAFIAIAFDQISIDETPELILDKEILIGEKTEEELKEIIKALETEADVKEIHLPEPPKVEKLKLPKIKEL